MIKVQSFELLSEEVTSIYIYIIHRSSFKSPALFDHGTSGRKSQQESNGVNNTNGGPTQVHVTQCTTMYFIYQYSMCIYVKQCLGEGVLNFKNYCQLLLKMKLVQTK